MQINQLRQLVLLLLKEWIEPMPNSLTRHALITFVGKELSLGDDWFETVEKKPALAPLLGKNSTMRK